MSVSPLDHDEVSTASYTPSEHDFKSLVAVVAMLDKRTDDLYEPLFRRLGVGDPIVISVPRHEEAITILKESVKDAKPHTPRRSLFSLEQVTDAASAWDQLKRWWIPFLLILVFGFFYLGNWFMTNGLTEYYERKAQATEMALRRETIVHQQEMERLRLEAEIYQIKNQNSSGEGSYVRP